MESSKLTRGPLCGISNATTMDSGTLVLGRSPQPGVQSEAIFRLSVQAKLERCIRYAASYLPGEAGTQLRALLNPRAIAAMTAMIGISAGAQLTPFGWIVDIAGFCLGAYALGSSIWQVSTDLRQFASGLQAAQTDSDLRSAGEHLARALSVIGVGTLLLWLTKRGARAMLTTQELVAAAEKVMLNTMDREVALWSGVDPTRIPGEYATLEGMLSETDAGKALLQQLRTRNDFRRDKDVWYALSERAAQLAADSHKEAHYFVAKSRGYRAALELGETPRNWWAAEGRLKLSKEITADMTRQGKSAAEIRNRVSSLDSWSQHRIEEQYYAEHRRIARGNRIYVEDEVFHKLEKLNLKGVWVHEIDANGVEVGEKFWQEF
jgi:hypothetical protein